MSGVPAALRSYVASVVTYDVNLGAPGVHRGLPSTTVTFVLPCDDPLEVGWRGISASRTTGWSCVSGLHDRPAEITHRGCQRGVQLALTLAGARALFGLPAGELAGRLLSLEDVGPAMRHLPEQLAETPHRRRRDLVLRAVIDELARQDRTAPRAEITQALARLIRRDPVGLVADEVGYSRRYLASLVRAETGVTPAQIRRLARFAESRRLMGRRPLAEIANTCGYADQAHLSRDWSALAGCPPTVWLREEFPWLQDLSEQAAED